MRKFKNDYAGSWFGYCKSVESAIIAATKHIVNDGYTRCTITDRESGQDVARIKLSDDRKRAVIETTSPFRKCT